MIDYKKCTKCILDSSITEIRFNEEGVCNFCMIHDDLERKYPLGNEGEARLNEIVNKIRKKGKNKNYDCIVGVSGGIDSTYTLYQTVKRGLRPLAVHFDNGWNSEIAVQNIHNATKALNVDLETIVADWVEFKDLQLSFLRASVPDAEVPTDWVIFSVLFRTAKKERIKYIIQGHSFRTEGSTPLSWTYMDGKYVKSIHKLFGKKKITSFPVMSMFDYFKHSVFSRLKQIRILYYTEYDEKKVLELLKSELGWKEYGGKHFESSYTSIFQSYILMRKFKIDKRKLHLSALIRSGQLEREDALSIIEEDPYKGGKEQLNYTIKKLGITEEEFNEIMNDDIKSFRDYPTYYSMIKRLEGPLKFANKINLLPDSVINKYFTLDKE
jgi:N-acetyl sugar amidotransferase